MWLIDVSCPKNKKRKTEVFFLLFYIFLYSIFSFQLSSKMYTRSLTSNKHSYNGHYTLHGRKCGYGRRIYANGDQYVGDWVNNKRHGYGVYTFNDTTQPQIKGWFDEGVPVEE